MRKIIGGIRTISGFMIYLIALIAGLTGFLFGFDEGIMSGVLQKIQADFGMDDKQTGFMMGFLPFGALVSSALTGKLCDWIGRLRTLQSVPIIFAIAIVTIIATSSYELLCTARFLLGISIGMSVVVSPMYIAETAPSSIRGKLVTCFQLAITIGILISYILNVFNELEYTSFGWRWMFGTGLIPAFVLFIGTLFLPESPRWLCMHHEKNKAKSVLNLLFHSHSAEVKALNEIEDAIEKGKRQTHAWRQLFSEKVRPCLSVGVLLFFFQQLSGINVIIYYAPIIFDQLQLGSTLAILLATVGIGAVNVLMTLVAMRWVEKMGRKHLLMLGFVGTAICLLTVGLISGFDLVEFYDVSALAIFVYIAFFAVSLGPLPWVMMPEIFPLKARGEGVSCSAASNWLFNTLVVTSFPIMLQQFGIGITFACYGIMCILGYFFALRYVPETKHLSLEEIEAHIRSGAPFRELGQKTR